MKKENIKYFKRITDAEVVLWARRSDGKERFIYNNPYFSDKGELICPIEEEIEPLEKCGFKEISEKEAFIEML